MSCLGNIIWFFLGGIWNLLSWTALGIFWCITIIGIPIGLQCFKMAGLTFAPFGKEVVYENNKDVNLIVNIIWMIFGGIEMAILHLLSAFFLAITIIGIPFAMQQLKFAKLALMPFGARVRRKY